MYVSAGCPVGDNANELLQEQVQRLSQLVSKQRLAEEAHMAEAAGPLRRSSACCCAVAVCRSFQLSHVRCTVVTLFCRTTSDVSFPEFPLVEEARMRPVLCRQKRRRMRRWKQRWRTQGLFFFLWRNVSHPKLPVFAHGQAGTTRGI